MALLKSLIIVGTCFSIFIGATAQSDSECLLAAGINGNRQLPEFIDREVVDKEELIPHRHQAIVASYQFQCCGNITEWGADVFRDGGMDQNQYSISFQVWRPSPTVQTDGCYSLVGQNMFTSVSLASGLIRETPLPAQQISFRSGDVVGFYIESDLENSLDERGVVLDTDYINEIVWYGSLDNIILTNPSCPLPVGKDRDSPLQTSTNAAPVITIATTIFTCPTRTSQPPKASKTALMSPKPTPSVSSFSQRAATITVSSVTPLATTKITSSLTTLPKASSDSETPTTSVTISPLSIGLIAGIIPLVIVVLTLVISICIGVFAKYRTSKRKTLKLKDSKRQASSSKEDHDAHASHNEESNQATNEEAYYSEINVECRDFDISTKPNEAYVSSILTNENMAYGITTNQQRNEVEEDDYI